MSEQSLESEFQQKLVAAFQVASTKSWLVSRPGQRRIDLNKQSAYLRSMVTSEDRSFAELVLNRTLYIPWFKLLHDLNQALDECLRVIGAEPVYLYLPRSKFGSEVLLITQVWARLSRSNLGGFIDGISGVPNNSHGD
jgi:hypothetical protein